MAFWNRNGSTPSPNLPPAGTHAIALSELNERLEQPLDVEHAFKSAALIYFTRRKHNRYDTSADAMTADAQRVDHFASCFGYKAKVFATAQQQAVLFYNDYEMLLAFEGSHYGVPRHYRRALNTRTTDATQSFAGKLHAGLNNILDEVILGSANQKTLYQDIKNTIEQFEKDGKQRRFTIAGHSSGGAVAALTAARLHHDLPDLHCDSVLLFGAPRFCDRQFKEAYDAELGKKIYRFDHFGDPITGMPLYHKEKWVHCGQWIPMDTQGRFLGMNDASLTEDSLSRLGKRERAAILKQIRLAQQAAEKESSATGTAFLNPSNYAKHHVSKYFDILHQNYLKHQTARSPRLTDIHQEDVLMWQLQSLEFDCPDIMLLLPAGEARETFALLQQKLHETINQWEKLRDTPTKKLQDGGYLAPYRYYIQPTPEGTFIPDSVIDAQSVARTKTIRSMATEIEALIYDFEECLKGTTADMQISTKLSKRESVLQQMESIVKGAQALLGASLSTHAAAPSRF
jgi:pimeloyl-ACP methyl ester carboxylesterase